jgi:hypothetical protein
MSWPQIIARFWGRMVFAALTFAAFVVTVDCGRKTADPASWKQTTGTSGIYGTSSSKGGGKVGIRYVDPDTGERVEGDMALPNDKVEDAVNHPGPDEQVVHYMVNIFGTRRVCTQTWFEACRQATGPSWWMYGGLGVLFLFVVGFLIRDIRVARSRPR